MYIYGKNNSVTIELSQDDVELIEKMLDNSDGDSFIEYIVEQSKIEFINNAPREK